MRIGLGNIRRAKMARKRSKRNKVLVMVRSFLRGRTLFEHVMNADQVDAPKLFEVRW